MKKIALRCLSLSDVLVLCVYFILSWTKRRKDSLRHDANSQPWEWNALQKVENTAGGPSRSMLRPWPTSRN